MGLCLSCRCGESHPKSSLLSLSHRHRRSSSSPSLTTFLHLWTTETTDATDTTSETTNKLSLDPLQTTPPVDDYSHLTIPHSSELFSLPSSDVGSTARSSTSSISLRWSMENPKPNLQSTNQPMQPRGSNPARRKSCSSLGQQELLPEHWQKKSLADTIARLEKFCDVKFFLENRTSSQSWVVPRSNSDYGSTILVQESCREFAQNLLWFANDHSGGMFSRCEGDHAKCKVVVTDEQTENETVPAGEKSFRRDAENFHETVPEDAENLESNEPVAASFLRDAENSQSNLDAGETPGMSRLPSLRFYDGEENIQFTDFEATFELLAAETSALHCSVEADQASRVSISTENVAPGLGVCQSALRQFRTRSDLSGGRQCKGSQQKGPKNPTLFRSALSDISSNGTPADEPLGRKNHQPLKSQISTGVLKRGGSLSLDLQNCSLSHLEFDHKLLKSERWQLPQGAAETLCRGEPQRIEAEEPQRTEVADSATIEQLAGEEGSAPSPSGDSAPLQSQPTKGRVSVDGGGEERLPESVCTDAAHGGDETLPIIHDNSDKSLSQAFNKLPKATTDTLEFSANGAQTAKEAGADYRPLWSWENEKWHEAPAALGNTVQPELPALHEPDCLPETLPGALSADVLIDPTLQFSNMKTCI